MRGFIHVLSVAMIGFSVLLALMAAADATRIHLQRPVKPIEAALDLIQRPTRAAEVALLAFICLRLNREPQQIGPATR
jgi:hypothetical protein